MISLAGPHTRILKLNKRLKDQSKSRSVIGGRSIELRDRRENFPQRARAYMHASPLIRTSRRGSLAQSSRWT